MAVDAIPYAFKPIQGLGKQTSQFTLFHEAVAGILSNGLIGNWRLGNVAIDRLNYALDHDLRLLTLRRL